MHHCANAGIGGAARPTLIGITVALALFSTATGADVVPADRPAVPLRHPPIVTPLEAAGTGIAPEVRVRIRVDTRGRVSRVRVLGIEPKSEFDPLFAAAATDTLMTWRYAPQIFEGRPIETELEWTIGFVPRDRTDEEDHVVVGGTAIDMFTVREDAARRQWQRILELPVERRREMLAEMTSKAQGYLNPATTRVQVSRRFVVYTDATRETAAMELAQTLEAAYDAVSRILGDSIPQQAEPYKISAFLFASEAPFLRMAHDLERMEWIAGFYNPVGLIAFHLEQSSARGVLEVLLHESTHAFVDRHVVRAGVELPRWLGEGFAEYVGNSEVKDGKLIPGRRPRARIYRSFWGKVLVDHTDNAFRLDQVLTAMRNGNSLTVERLMGLDVETFYDEDRSQYYTMSWLIVHFLRHGEDGWADRQFPEFLLYCAEGFPPTDALTAVYGRPAAQLEDDFRAYVKKLAG